MKLRRNEKFIKWGLTAFFVFVGCALFWIIFSNLSGFYDMIRKFISIISPVLYGVLFAYMMNPIVKRLRPVFDKLMAKTKLKEKTAKKISKGISITCGLLVLLLCIYALIALIVPSLIDSLEYLLQHDRIMSYYNTINNWLNDTFAGTDLEKWLSENVDTVLTMLTDTLKQLDITAIIGGLTNSVYAVVMFVFDLLLGIIAAVYLLISKEQLVAQAKKITVALFSPAHADRLIELARRTNRIFTDYLLGKLIDAVLVGVVTYIAMLLMGMNYAPLIAVLVGVTNVIPFFGPFLGAIPSVILLLLDNPMDAVYFSIFILVLQQVEGNILYNRIIGGQLGISDLWVLVSILVFGGIFGFGGMLLGAPIFAVLYTIIADVINKRLKKKRFPTCTDEYYAIGCVADLPVEPPPSYSYVTVDPKYDLQIDPEDAYDEAFEDYED